jgi:hypothetical protein
MSRRARKSTNKEEEPHVTEDKSEAQTETESSKNLTQTLELINKIKGTTEIVKPADLENISNKLNKLEELSMVSKEINEIKSEFTSLSTYAKIFFGVGAAALLIFCINGVITLLNNLKPK